MMYLSVCSGVEAASLAWEPRGWQPVAFSEIEPFPCAVLAQRWPNVPNWGDINRFKDWPDATIDLLVGGTPCQSFSVAGLRKGLDDPRGNLTLTFLAIAERYKPTWVCWENVPGIISDSTEALQSFLDGLEALGYILDIEILDAQWFGLAQRRRRIFVCGQHRDDLLKTKTPSSALTIAQCVTEILHSICLAGSSRFANARESLVSAALSASGVRRRMMLFGLGEDENLWPKWRSLLEGVATRSSRGQGSSDSANGAFPAAGTPVVSLIDSKTGDLSTLTDQSLRGVLDAALDVVRSFITSTATRTITQTEIFTCSKAVLSIGALIARSNPSLPAFWSAASSNLTAMKDFTAYARSASSDLFTELEWLQPWRDFVGEAEQTSQSLGNITVGCFGKIQSIAESLRGNPSPRREAGKRVAGTFSAGAHPGGYNGQDANNDLLVAHALRADGFDASEDGTGRGTPLIAFSACDHGADAQMGKTPTLRVGSGAKAGGGQQMAVAFEMRGREGGAQFEGPHATANIRAASGGSSKSYVAFAQNSRDELRLLGGDGQSVGALAAEPGMKQQTFVSTGWAVRRLTPLECERLQGMPDGHTAVTYRGKPAADGPRYKAIGNSMAVNVMAWIGHRIDLVLSSLTHRDAA